MRLSLAAFRIIRHQSMDWNPLAVVAAVAKVVDQEVASDPGFQGLDKDAS